MLASEMVANRPMITLQCGNYANYIGAHFWNLQVAKLPVFSLYSGCSLQEAGFVYGGNDGGSGELLEVDNDVLFREGLTMKGEVTYTPRLLSVDLQGSLGLLPQCGELYGRFSDKNILLKFEHQINIAGLRYQVARVSHGGQDVR